MSPWLIRRRVGLLFGVAVAVTSWLLTGIGPTAMACAAALIIAIGGDAVRRVRGARRERRQVHFERVAVPIAGISWALAGIADLAAPADRVIRAARELHPLTGAPAVALAHGHLAGPWTTAINVLVGGALVSSLFVARALRRPERPVGDGAAAALDRARGIVEQYGEDSLAPFILRPDKSFEFAGDAVIAYRVIGETAVISGDPIGPDGDAAEALEQLVHRARQAGLLVAAYGASDRRLRAYRALGMRAIRAGEEAVVDATGFTLEGRPVRKLRQSVHRVKRRGWRIEIYEGREIDAELEAAIDAVEAEWRAPRGRMLGFAMSMGEFELGVRPADVYVLAFSPEHRLQGVMRFLAHRDKLSLDTMRRVGETPNGLNEALVCRALEYARARGIGEVSLNYAGLAHLVRTDAPSPRLARALMRALVWPLRGRFQMDRLVLFNQKFSPAWRPRYLVCESRAALPRAVFRVLQAEGYLPPPESARSSRPAERWRHRASSTLHDGVGG